MVTAWVRSPGKAFESICRGGGTSQAVIDNYHLRPEAVSWVIAGLYR